MTLPIAPLGDLVEVTSGFAFKSTEFNTSGDGLPLVRIRDVVDGSSDTYYSGDYKQDFLVEDGDALIGMDGEFNLGRWRGGRALLNQRVCKVVAKDKRLDQEYLLRFLPSALKSIEDATPFVTVKHLSVKVLRDIRIPLPPLPEQRRIAAILDKAEALRAKRREAIAKLDQLLQSVFLDMFGDPVTNPKGWSISTLGDECLEIKNGLSVRQTDDAAGVPISRIETISRGEIDTSRVGFANLTSADSEGHLLKPGDILFSHINSTEHLCKCAIYERRHGALVHGMNLLRLRPSETLEPYFLLYLIKNRRYRASLMIYENRAVNQSSIAGSKIKAHRMPLPPREVQSRFVEVVRAIQRITDRGRQALARSDAQFSSLQADLFAA